MWLLDVTTQTVRYDLVFFKEFLLLIAVCAAYTIILGCSETKRYNLRRWIDDWRQPYITR